MPFVHFIDVLDQNHFRAKVDHFPSLHSTDRLNRWRAAHNAAESKMGENPYEFGDQLPRFIVVEFAGERGYANAVKVVASVDNVETANLHCRAAAGAYGATALEIPAHDPKTCQHSSCIDARMTPAQREMDAYMDRLDRTLSGAQIFAHLNGHTVCDWKYAEMPTTRVAIPAIDHQATADTEAENERAGYRVSDTLKSSGKQDFLRRIIAEAGPPTESAWAQDSEASHLEWERSQAPAVTWFLNTDGTVELTWHQRTMIARAIASGQTQGTVV